MPDLVDAPVWDVEDNTRLEGADYLAQLYVTLYEEVRQLDPPYSILVGHWEPIGVPVPFQTGTGAGYIDTTRTDPKREITRAYWLMPDTLPCQVRVWEAAKGSSYEEAYENAGLIGESDIFELQPRKVYSPPLPLDYLVGLKSFHLRHAPITVILANSLSNALDAPVFEVDGTTRLAGTNYLAQLYSGPTPANLVPTGPPVTFQTANGAGYFPPLGADRMRLVEGISPADVAYCQVRVWRGAAGGTWEQARTNSQAVGVSDLCQLQAGNAVPYYLKGLKSFALGRVASIGGIEVSLACWLRSPVLEGANRFRIPMLGLGTETFDIQVSEDLEHWTTLTQATNAFGFIRFDDPEAQQRPWRFYRTLFRY
ncbi:MAG: hypothetical protein M1608_12135 [Candidatus Omnitrophica bacterium]|nr:hypothetical protein [Candidatus Omnitrophota bacterium]